MSPITAGARWRVKLSPWEKSMHDPWTIAGFVLLCVAAVLLCWDVFAEEAGSGTRRGRTARPTLARWRKVPDRQRTLVPDTDFIAEHVPA